MKLFYPEMVFFEREALDYPLGRKLYKEFQKQGISIKITKSHNRITGIPGDTLAAQYIHAKQTLVVGVKKSMNLEPCKPSADYQFPLVTSCPGQCEYCYLQTTLGKKPYIRVYVNVDEILQTVQKYINQNAPRKTFFEVSSTADPLALEHLTGSLQKTITFFGEQPYGYLRFVTKFANIDPLLQLEHRNHTHIRFSINTDYVINNFEHNTASLAERLAAAQKVSLAGYPLGFIIAPLMLYPNWRDDYAKLIKEVDECLRAPVKDNLTFELIMHRFTKRAKSIIQERFPQTKLDLNEANRELKWGKYGRVKYVYPKEKAHELKIHLTNLIKKHFPHATIEYFT